MAEEDILDVMPSGEQAPAEASDDAPPQRAEIDWKAKADELSAKLKKQTGRLRKLESAITKQEQLHLENMKQQREKILSDLQVKKFKAIKDGDAETVARVDKEMSDTDRKFVQAAESTKPNDEFERFLEHNDWYDDNRKMTLWAKAYAAELRKEDPNLSLREMFRMVGEEVRKEFPEAFMNTERSKPAAVEGGGAPAHKAKDGSPGWDQIPKDYRPVFESMWRQKAWGEVPKREAARKYAADLVELGVIGE